MTIELHRERTSSPSVIECDVCHTVLSMIGDPATIFRSVTCCGRVYSIEVEAFKVVSLPDRDEANG